MFGSLLIYIASGAIKEYLGAHPIKWPDPSLSRLGGPGDGAGEPPTTSVEVFLELLKESHGLFSQEHFWQGCVRSFGEWYRDLPDRRNGLDVDLIRQGLKAKAYRNFYPSMIDSLHVWSMLVEVGGFNRCYLDSVDDYSSKTDLTVFAGSTEYKIALQGRRVPVSRPAARGDVPANAYVVCLPSREQRPPGIGNKQWFEIDDFFRTWPDFRFDPGWQQRSQRTFC